MQGSYYPYGEDKGTPLANDQFKYATSWRDSATSLDYADQRYYVNNFGRFMTPDPYRANNGEAGDSTDPSSWNKFSYTRGDPVNLYDPFGLFTCPPGWICVTVTDQSGTSYILANINTIINGSSGGSTGGTNIKGGHGPATCLSPLIAFNNMCVTQQVYQLLQQELQQVQAGNCQYGQVRNSQGSCVNVSAEPIRLRFPVQIGAALAATALLPIVWTSYAFSTTHVMLRPALPFFRVFFHSCTQAR